MSTTPSQENPQPAPAPLIFIVDDDVSVLRVTAAVLQNCGFELRSFSDPREALRAIRDEGSCPVVLVTDYAMDPMTGLELAEHSVRALPSLKTILASGTIAPEVAESHSSCVHRFLAKPFLPGDLRALIRELLIEPDRS